MSPSCPGRGARFAGDHARLVRPALVPALVALLASLLAPDLPVAAEEKEALPVALPPPTALPPKPQPQPTLLRRQLVEPLPGPSTRCC